MYLGEGDSMVTESSKARRAPTPRGVPFFGNLFEAWRDPIGLFQRATREHGDVVCFRFGPYRYFLVNDPAGA